MTTVITILYYLTKINNTKATTIKKTENEILFKPLGYMIPELSWATLRLKINISNMFIETNDICKAANSMQMELNKLKGKYGVEMNPKKANKLNHHLTIMVSHDIIRY